MRKIILIIFFIYGSSSYAQTYITIDAGIATFNMRDMKLLQKSILSNNNVFDFGIVQEFPPYFQYQLGFKQVGLSTNEKLIIGGVFSFTSTGGRVASSDFSGSVKGDQLINVFSIGPEIGYILSSSKKLNVAIEAITSFDFTNMEIKSTLTLGNQDYTNSQKFVAYGASIQPHFNLNYSYKFLMFYTYLGGHVTVIQQPFLSKEDKESEITVDGSTSLKPQWNGVRVGIGLAIKI
jgi:hypothetical protein